MFFTIADAAALIAAELHPVNDSSEYLASCADAERRYLAALQNAVCESEIVYRDPVSRLPIKQEGIAAMLTSHWCVISRADLNDWLARIGVGIQLTAASGDVAFRSANTESATSAPCAQPTSAELAHVLGPYLVSDRDSDWLKRRLNDADRYPKLVKFRRQEGKKKTSVWNAGGVVVYLVELKAMTWATAKEAMENHYPESIDVLEGLGEREPHSAQSWFPKATG